MHLMPLIIESSCRTLEHKLTHLAKRITHIDDNSQKKYCSMMIPHKTMLSYLGNNKRYSLHEITHPHYQRLGDRVKDQLQSPMRP